MQDTKVTVEEDHSDTVQGRFWMCLRTMGQMLYDRYGTQVELPSYESVLCKLQGLDLADTDRSQQLMNQFDMVVECKRDDTTVHVFFLCGKIGVKTESMLKVKALFPEASADESLGDEEVVDDTQIEEFAELAEAQKGTMTGKPPDTIILVQVENCTITPPARKVAAKIPAIIEIFDHNDLKRNITKHRLQPKFSLLSQSEADDLKQKYCVKNDQIPHMRWEDPIRRYYGLRVDQIVRILRLADGGKELSYRIVVPPNISKKK